MSLHLTYTSKKAVYDSQRQVHSSLIFLFFGVIFFLPFGADFGGVVAAVGDFVGVAAAWLLVKGPGLAAAWLLVKGPGLLVEAAYVLLVGVVGSMLLTETSNHGDGSFFPFLFFAPFLGQPASLCPSSPHLLHLFKDPFLDPPSHQLFILCFLVLPAPFFCLLGVADAAQSLYSLVATDSCQ